jgi:hypothetical protein
MGFNRAAIFPFASAPVALLALLGAFCMGCTGREDGSKVLPAMKSDPSTTPSRTIEQVQAIHEVAWLAIPGVVGVGIATCEGKPCLQVYVEAADTAPGQIPDSVEGFAVQIVVTGTVRPLPTQSDP